MKFYNQVLLYTICFYSAIKNKAIDVHLGINISYSTLELHESTSLWLHLWILIRLKVADKWK